MAQPEEPMDVDSSMCDFDNKENAYQHGNLPSRTEKGYEELDVAELNMKLKYAMTSTGSMSKSYTLDNQTFDKFTDNGNMTQSLHAMCPKSEKPKDLPLQNLTSDLVENRSVLRPLVSTVTLDSDIKVTVSTPHESDDYISLPSSSSSLAQTPEVTTPTKDIREEGSPIMRSLKSVLNMFRPSQSPITMDEDLKSEVLSPPIVNSPHAPDNNQNNQSLLVSTPLAARKTDMLTKRTSPNKETVVFNEDLEKELLWKDESTILFDDEKVPLHKLFLQNTKPVTPKATVNLEKPENPINLHTDEIESPPESKLDSTVEYMDISYQDKTLNAGQVESDSEFVDCETTFNKNESLFSAESSLDDMEFLDSTKNIVDKLSAIMTDNTLNVSTNTLEASTGSVDLSNVSTVTMQTKAENVENNTQENLSIQDHEEDKTLEEIVKPTTDPDQLSVKVIVPKDQLGFKNANQDVETVAAHVSLSLTDNINDNPVISHPDKIFKNCNMPEPHIKENKSQVKDYTSQVAHSVQDNLIHDASVQDKSDSLVVNSLSQIPLIADPRVLLFNISSEMTVEDVQVNENAVQSIPSEVPLPDDDELASLPPINDNITNGNNTTINNASIVIEDNSIELDTKPENYSNTNITVNVVQENVKIADVAKVFSVELGNIPENYLNANTTVNIVKEDIKISESFAKEVSAGLEPKQNQNTVIKNVEKENNLSQSYVLLNNETEPENTNVVNKLNAELAVSDTDPVSATDRKVEQIDNLSDYIETGNIITVTEFGTTQVLSPHQVLLASETEKIIAHVIPKLDECNDLLTESLQQDQDLAVKITDDATALPKVENEHSGDKVVISSLVTLELERNIPKNNVSNLEESNPLTIDIPKSPRPQNYIAPVSDLVIQGTVQESLPAGTVQGSVREIPQDLSTPNSYVREHIMKTIPGSFLTNLNDSIEKRKSLEAEMEQEIVQTGKKYIETVIEQSEVETEMKEENFKTEIKHENIETETKLENVEIEIKQGKVETETEQINFVTEIKQDKFGTIVMEPSVIAESTKIGDSNIKSTNNDNGILMTQPQNVDELLHDHEVTTGLQLQPANINITENPVALDIFLQENMHVNSPGLHKTELKEINLNEIEKNTCPIDIISNSSINSVRYQDNMEKIESKSHISVSNEIVSSNDEFCNKDKMAIVAEVIVTPLAFEIPLKSHATYDSANNQICDLHNAPATENQFEAVISTDVGTEKQDCDMTMTVLSSVNYSQDQALVISGPSFKKIESTDEEIVVSENNSPFVSLTQNEVVPESTVIINNKQVDMDLNNFEEIESPFSSSDNIKSPRKSPPIASKGYNFNFDEIDDPFATKTRIKQSPGNDSSPNQTFSHMDDTLPVEDVPIPQKVNRKISQPQRNPVRANKKNNSTFAGSKSINTKAKSTLKNDLKVSEKHDMPKLSKVEQWNQVIEIPHEEIKIKTDTEKQSDDSDNVDTKSIEQSTYFSAGTSLSDSATKVIFSEIDDPNFNPFATKTKIQMSPPPSLNATFPSAKDIIVPKIDDSEFNSSAPKTRKSQPSSLNGTFNKSTSFPTITISSNANDMIISSHKQLSPIPREVAVYDKELVDPNVACLSKTSTMQSMQTVCSINTEDQDTIEGPFLDEMELHEDEKMDFDADDGMFEFGELPPGNKQYAEGEMFIDAEAFEFLLNQNQTNATADNGKESLFLKFDPLFAKRASTAGLSTRKSMLRRDVPIMSPKHNTSIAIKCLDSTFEAIEETPQQDVTIKTPQKHISPIVTTTKILDSTFEAIPTPKFPEHDIPMKTPQKQTTIATTIHDSTFEAIPTQMSPQQPSITTQQNDSTFVAITSQDVKILTPLQGVKSPLRGIKTPPHRDLRTPPRDSSFASVTPFATTSKLNKSVDADGALGESSDDLNVTIAKPTMVVSPAFNPVVTPRRATTPSRRSVTFASPAIAVIDRLLSINNSGLGYDSMLISPDSEADQALIQLRELLAEKELSVQNLRTESKDLRERLGNLESQMKNLDAVGQERLKNINALNDKLNKTLQENKSMARVVEEYERTIASLITETEQDKKIHAEERMKLLSERDDATSHLSSMEISFSDLHSKYEKSKQIIFAFKAHDEALKKSQKDFEDKLAKMESNYESLKQHATAKLNHANEELQKINRAHEAEVLKLNTMLKRKEVDVASLEETLAQKIKTNEELAAICDSLLAKFA